MAAQQPPPTGEGEQHWADRWIEELRASLPEAPPNERPAAAARLGAMLLECARDDEADAVLLAARRDAVRAQEPRELARIEIALAAAAIARDDDDAARARLSHARALLPTPPPGIASRVWLVDVRLARLGGLPAPPPPPQPEASPDAPLDPAARHELSAELALERARIARESGALASAHLELSKAHEIVQLEGSERLLAAFELEAACYAAAVGEVEQAGERFRGAIQRHRDAGLRRGEGRAMIRYAEHIASLGERPVGDA